MHTLAKRFDEATRCHEQGMYTPASILCVLAIEQALRLLYLDGLYELDDPTRLRCQDVERQQGKNGNYGVADFTMGELVGLYHRSKFLDELSSASERDLSDLHLVRLDKLNKLRTDFVHKGLEASERNSSFLLQILEDALQACGVSIPVACTPVPAKAAKSAPNSPPKKKEAVREDRVEERVVSSPAAADSDVGEVARPPRSSSTSKSAPPPASSASKPASPPAAVAQELLSEIAGRLVRVEPGEFPFYTSKRAAPKTVEITRALYFDKTPVTQGLYSRVVGVNPSLFKCGDDYPVEKVSWLDAVAFCNRLSLKLGLKEVYTIPSTPRGRVEVRFGATGFRLPTEAEWLLACGAAPPTRKALDQCAWYKKKGTQPVGKLEANANGLFDMLGNVWEWCNDWHLPSPDLSSPDPTGPETGVAKVIRGGSWSDFHTAVTPKHRDKKHPDTTQDNIGFRIVTTTPLLQESVKER